jgi:hypothetical protein
MIYVFVKIIHMNLAVKFNLLKNTQPHYSYKPESCLENDNYKLYRVFHNSRPREKEETRDRIWMCNFEEKKN